MQDFNDIFSTLFGDKKDKKPLSPLQELGRRFLEIAKEHRSNEEKCSHCGSEDPAVDACFYCKMD